MSTVRNIIGKLVLAAGTAAVAGLVLPCRGEAQEYLDEIRGEFFGHLDLGVPLGEFGTFVGLGGGFGGGGVLSLDESGILGLRAEGNVLVYGVEHDIVPLVPFVDVERQTTNQVYSAGVGPQVYLATGGIRPYVYGTIGLSYFVTSTSVNGTYEREPIASTTNHDDIQMALTGGGGLSVRIREGENPLSLDFSAFYRYNGNAEYLANGTDNLKKLRRGRWVANPIRSQANLMTYRVGVSVGVG